MLNSLVIKRHFSFNLFDSSLKIKRISSSNVFNTAKDYHHHQSNKVTFPDTKYDCIVIGLGAMGSSTLYHLAKNGVKVLGLEQFKVAHSNGSSHGLSRIIRLAYFEHPSYVSMLRRSYVLWDELQKENGRNLFIKTGSLDIGLKNSIIFKGSKYTCEKENIKHEILDKKQIIQRFKGWQTLEDNLEDIYAVYQPDGGILNPEQCVLAHIEQAKKHNAKVNEEETVLDIQLINKNEVLVKTNKNNYLTSRIVLSSGPWLSGFIKNSSSLSKIDSLRKIADSLNPQRNVVIWYEALKPELYQPNNFPVFVLSHENDYFYGFPIYDTGVHPYEKNGFKIGKYHHRKENLSYEMLNLNTKWRSNFELEDEEVIGLAMKSYLKPAYGPVLKQSACIFTNTPDEHFIIDACPDPSNPTISIISACSGHGFKFSSMIGESMAHLIIKKQYSLAHVSWLQANRLG